METVTKAKILLIKEYSNDLREYILSPEKYRRFDAGTFLQLSLDLVDASNYWPESRTFSIASAYNKDKTIKLIIRKVGEYTSKIFDNLVVGNEVSIKYAFGDMVLPQFDDKHDIICIAAGSGIAPFLSFYEELKSENMLERFKLLYTVRREEDFIQYENLSEDLNENQRKFFVTDKKSKKGINRLMTVKDILNISKNKTKSHYYICGSPEFITFFKNELKNNGIKNIYLDEWE